MLMKVVVIIVQSKLYRARMRARVRERERKRGSCLLVVTAACGEERGQEVVASVFPRFCIPLR